MDDRVRAVRRWFDRIYLGGIPQLSPNDTAFLGFICILTAIEALAGYRYSDSMGNGRRFKEFVKNYFPHGLATLADELWDFRNGMIHGFSPRRFALTEHQSHLHLVRTLSGDVLLNFEDCYAALLQAANKYFAELESSDELQAVCLERITNKNGGNIGVGPIEIQLGETPA
jgi:hypothetical protein